MTDVRPDAESETHVGEGDTRDARPEIDEGCPPADEMRPPWEREAGDEWCITPNVRDLAPLWWAPAPGCEQVTYSDYLYARAWDVWDGTIVYGYRAAHIVQIDTRTQFDITADRPRGEPDFDPYDPRISGDDVVYYAQGAPPTAPPMEHYIFHYSIAATRYRLLLKTVKQTEDYVDYPGSRPCFLNDDVFGDVAVLRQHAYGCSGCEFNLVLFDLRTGAETNLTDYRGGRCFWDSNMWGPLIISDFAGGGALMLSDVTHPEAGASLFAVGPADQWDSTIWEDLVCWTDLREGSGTMMGGPFDNSEVWCAEVGIEEAWKVSDEPDSDEVALPTIFGDWIAWGVSPTYNMYYGNEIRLYYHPTGERFALTERLGSWHPRLMFRPRLWGDYLYFQAVNNPPPPWPEPPEAENVYRCHLPTLFPEMYD